ncbi:hypothetical protein [Nonomuraea sediminis]|uniref:hypothetical protein n=1 Tax=Nonomuraea sediminis TaxID=2835864 RepID=UPI001BDCEA39|nr:hypothetical protein [Nonomuraea sediminis]
MAEKNPDDWHSWNGGFALPGGWPYPSPGINVDRAALKRVAFQMEQTIQDAVKGGPYLPRFDPVPESSWNDAAVRETDGGDAGSVGKFPNDTKDYFDLSGTFGHELWQENGVSGPYGGGSSWMEVAGYLPGSWESVKHFKKNLERTVTTIDGYGELFFESFKGLADTVVLTALNYDTAEDILQHGKGAFRTAIDGRGVVKADEPLCQGSWFCENVSSNEAPVIKTFFERCHPELLAAAGRTLRGTADRLAAGVGALAHHAEQLAHTWPGETSTLCLDALRKLHASGRTIAYAAGRTSEVCTGFSSAFAEYKTQGEHLNVDKAGWFDRTFFDGNDDDRKDKSRAQELLMNFNSRLGEAFAMLPAELEVCLPQLQGFQYFAGPMSATSFDDLVSQVNVNDAMRILRSVEDDPKDLLPLS